LKKKYRNEQIKKEEKKLGTDLNCREGNANVFAKFSNSTIRSFSPSGSAKVFFFFPKFNSLEFFFAIFLFK
jgi:hypothetical protein